MIVLDTHIWIWWVSQRDQLSKRLRVQLDEAEEDSLAVSVISCWEVAKLVERGRLELGLSVESWLQTALAYPSIRLIDLLPEIAVASTQLPGTFHRDPADQIIVATAIVLGCPLATVDKRIATYEHVRTIE